MVIPVPVGAAKQKVWTEFFLKFMENVAVASRKEPLPTRQYVEDVYNYYVDQEQILSDLGFKVLYLLSRKLNEDPLAKLKPDKLAGPCIADVPEKMKMTYNDFGSGLDLLRTFLQNYAHLIPSNMKKLRANAAIVRAVRETIGYDELQGTVRSPPEEELNKDEFIIFIEKFCELADTECPPRHTISTWYDCRGDWNRTDSLSLEAVRLLEIVKTAMLDRPGEHVNWGQLWKYYGERPMEDYNCRRHCQLLRKFLTKVSRLVPENTKADQVTSLIADAMRYVAFNNVQQYHMSVGGYYRGDEMMHQSKMRRTNTRRNNRMPVPHDADSKSTIGPDNQSPRELETYRENMPSAPDSRSYTSPAEGYYYYQNYPNQQHYYSASEWPTPRGGQQTARGEAPGPPPPPAGPPPSAPMQYSGSQGQQPPPSGARPAYDIDFEQQYAHAQQARTASAGTSDRPYYFPSFKQYQAGSGEHYNDQSTSRSYTQQAPFPSEEASGGYMASTSTSTTSVSSVAGMKRPVENVEVSQAKMSRHAPVPKEPMTARDPPAAKPPPPAEDRPSTAPENAKDTKDSVSSTGQSKQGLSLLMQAVEMTET
eukprot:Clim_evm21s165 gene=Clim_evmTU21s165